MRVLIAPAAFKETFSPRAVADAIGVGVCRALPEAELLVCPVADGGDGLLDVILPVGSLRERVQVTGPLGEFVSAELGWIDPETAVFESRTACGLALVPVEARDPLRTTTRGVGELIWEASERGARSVIVGLGGSATVDAGTGAARGLGWTFTDDTGAPLAEGGGPLADLGRLERGWALSARIVALTDVASPLVGSDGAAPVFGPQKGASPTAVARLEAGLGRVAELFARHGRPELATVPGGGAAGGLGAGLAFFARAELVAGASWVLDRVGFDAALATADLVITAEGRFDRTSFAGKAPGEVVRRAQQARKKVAVVAGAATDLIGVHVATEDGARLDAEGIAALAERVAREAFGLPAP
jgi:glycerate 2-kinase